MNKKIYDAVVTTGKYTGKDGKERNRYLTVGAVFQNEKGQSSLKLEALPAAGFTGWINFYEPKQAERPASGDGEPYSDDIPF